MLSTDWWKVDNLSISDLLKIPDSQLFDPTFPL